MSVGKFLDRALGDVGKVLLPVIGVAAAVFTGGASLGLLTPILGAGATSVGGALSALGIASDTLLGSALTGAITTAGYGALTGGVTALLTGGKVLKSMGIGAVAGAITGGVTGALGYAFPETFGTPIPDHVDITGPVGRTPNIISDGPGTGGIAGNLGGQDFRPGLLNQSPVSVQQLAPPNPAPVGAPTVGAPAPVTPAAATTTPASGGGLLSNLGKSLTSPDSIGSVIKGIGNAITGDAQSEAYLQAGADQRNFYTQNYNSGTKGLFTQAPNIDRSTLRAPVQAFPQNNTGHYEYDPNLRKLVFIPAGTQQTA